MMKEITEFNGHIMGIPVIASCAVLENTQAFHRYELLISVNGSVPKTHIIEVTIQNNAIEKCNISNIDHNNFLLIYMIFGRFVSIPA